MKDLKEESTKKSVESDTWEIVTKKEFEEYLKSYPNKLERDYYMDCYSWNDFSDGKIWPESIIAMMSNGGNNAPIKYEIHKKR